MGSCDVLLGNVCLNGVRAVATVFSYSKSCTCPCEFCLQGQSLIWRDAAKLPTSIFSLSEGRHHFSSVGSAMLLTSSDKDTWRPLGCRLAMFQFQISLKGIMAGFFLFLREHNSGLWRVESWGCEGLHLEFFEAQMTGSALWLDSMSFFFWWNGNNHWTKWAL